MRVAYSIAQITEAVALSRVVGAEAAAETLGIAPRTVRKWAGQAGDRPVIDADADQWQRLHDLAMAKTTALVASGKLPARTVAVIAGIAARNLRVGRSVVVPDVDAEPDDPTPLATAAHRRFMDWLDSLPEPDRVPAKRWLRDEIDRILLKRREGEAPEPMEPREGEDPRSDAAGAAMWDTFREGMAADLPRILIESAEREAIEVARRAQRNMAGGWLEDDECDLLIQADQYLEDNP